MTWNSNDIIAQYGGSIIYKESRFFRLYNCSCSGPLNNNDCGGLIGYKACQNAGKCIIKNCKSNCNITSSSSYSGGIAAHEFGSWTGGNDNIGNDISGDNTGDKFGSSVALSDEGDILAVGASNSDTNIGQVKVYYRNNNSWVQKGSTIIGTKANSYSGTSVSLSSDGNILAIGERGTTSVSNTSRCVIKQWDSITSDWIDYGDSIGYSPKAHFGKSVSLSYDGNRLAVGAPLYLNKGFVRVYDYSDGSWSQIGSDLIGNANYKEYGHSVALSRSGEYLIVGQIYGTNNLSAQGGVYVYKYESSEWTQVGTTLYGSEANAYAGCSVSISNDGQIIAFGIYNGTGNNSTSGLVRVYRLVNDDWVQYGTDINGTTANDRFGYSVQLSGDGKTIIIGEPKDGTDKGRIFVYKYIDNDSDWSTFRNKTGSSNNGEFGKAVAISNNSYFMVGGADVGDTNGTSSGYIRSYDINYSSELIIKNSFYINDIEGTYCGGIVAGCYYQRVGVNIVLDNCFSKGSLNDSVTVAESSGGIIGSNFCSWSYMSNSCILNNCFTLLENGGTAGTSEGLVGPDVIATLNNCFSQTNLGGDSAVITNNDSYEKTAVDTYKTNSTIPNNWDPLLWSSASNDYPRLEVFINGTDWDSNGGVHASDYNYTLLYPTTINDYYFFKNNITENNRNFINRFNIYNSETVRDQIVDFSGLSETNKKFLRHSMLSIIFKNNSLKNYFKMTPTNLGLDSLSTKNYIYCFTVGTYSNPTIIDCTTQINNDNGVYANLDNEGDSVKFTKNSDYLQVTKKPNGDYFLNIFENDISTTDTAADDDTKTILGYEFYFGGAGSDGDGEGGGPCFTNTCYILTPTGYRNVSLLKPNDTIVTSDKRHINIINIFKTNCIRKFKPYYIPKNSLDDNMPSVDTYISRDHKFFHNNQWVKPKNTNLYKKWSQKDLIYYHTDHLIVNNVIMESWDGKTSHTEKSLDK